MNQQVLARKWRPTTFDQLIGQEHVRKALTHALNTGRLHHAYLFTGTRGVGKTTIARILARCLNCETGVSAIPCGECRNCQAISDNRFVDLLEVDAASRTKVDDTRELLENVSYAPSQGRYKVYLIDEVHMLTTHSFNALLKTLEEPPEHVVFLLATTDPQKLLPTVLSRCLQFHLRDLGPDLIESHLEHVLSEEQVTFEKDALWHLAKAGRGSVRDAMTLLDQAIAHGEGSVSADNVVEMLGTQGVSEIPQLLSDIAAGQATDALSRISDLARETPDWMALISGMQSLLHHVAIAQVTDQGINHLSPGEQKAVRELAAVMSPEFLQLAYQFALTGYRDLPMASDARSAFEMLVLRMIAFRPARAGEVISGSSAAQPTPDAEPIIEPEPDQPPSSTTPIESIENRLPEPEPGPEPEPRPVRTVEESQMLAESGNSETVDQRTSSETANVQSNESAPSNFASQLLSTSLSESPITEEHDDESDDDPQVETVSQPTLALSPEAWVFECRLLPVTGMTASLLAQTVLVSASPETVHLATNAHTDSLLNEMHRRRVSDAFATQLGGSPDLVIEVRDQLGETPEAYRLRMKEERLHLAQSQFQDDPFITALTERFDASVRIDTIQPRNGDHHV
ncbi:DNA polymerase III subunit gamma/tau [Litorivicinus sp.]|nr:DNA polymerase III subunit gamma/tau [Litorivicinus sp.]MDC1087990.1 DNA polymerase III subunit gamma/tau [Litorivicinus sp.]